MATVGGVGLLFLAARTVRRPVVRSVLLAGAAGVSFGIASVFTKTVAVDWTSAGPVRAGARACWSSRCWRPRGLLLSQASYRGAGLAAPLATVTVVNPVVAAAVGLTLFGEGFRYGMPGTVLALGSGMVAASGLVLLTTERLGRRARPDDRDSLSPTRSSPAAPSAPWDRRPDGPAPGTASSRTPAAGPGVADAGSVPVQAGTDTGSRLSAAASTVPTVSSDADTARSEVGEGIDVGSVARPRAHLEVEMRSRAVAGGS